jgi:hypothetical protein
VALHSVAGGGAHGGDAGEFRGQAVAARALHAGAGVTLCARAQSPCAVALRVRRRFRGGARVRGGETRLRHLPEERVDLRACLRHAVGVARVPDLDLCLLADRADGRRGDRDHDARRGWGPRKGCAVAARRGGRAPGPGRNPHAVCAGGAIAARGSHKGCCLPNPCRHATLRAAFRTGVPPTCGP